MANLFAETFAFGPIAPFLIAVGCFTACFFIVYFTWQENYGDQKMDLSGSYKNGLKIILRDRTILFLGCVQSIVESCMYIFVFLWTPVLSSDSAPLGMIFSCFMVAIMIGSSSFSVLLTSNFKPQDTLFLSSVIFGACTAICSLIAGPEASFLQRTICLLVFIVLEASIGLYFPSVGCLRSQLIPENQRATVTNWFRVPMNLITCLTLLAVNHPTVARDKRAIFASCTSLLITGALIANKFRARLKGE